MIVRTGDTGVETVFSTSGDLTAVTTVPAPAERLDDDAPPGSVARPSCRTGPVEGPSPGLVFVNVEDGAGFPLT